MKLVDNYSTRIGHLVDLYRGAVPLGRLILEATRQQASLPELKLERNDVGEVFLHITFADSSEIVLGVTEEFT